MNILSHSAESNRKLLNQLLDTPHNLLVMLQPCLWVFMIIRLRTRLWIGLVMGHENMRSKLSGHQFNSKDKINAFILEKEEKWFERGNVSNSHHSTRKGFSVSCFYMPGTYVKAIPSSHVAWLDRSTTRCTVWWRPSDLVAIHLSFCDESNSIDLLFSSAWTVHYIRWNDPNFTLYLYLKMYSRNILAKVNIIKRG